MAAQVALASESLPEITRTHKLCPPHRDAKTTARMPSFSKINNDEVVELDQPGLLQRGECAVFVDGLDRLGAQFDFHSATQFWNVDALGVQVGRNGAFHDLGDVTSDTTLLLRETGTVNSTTDTDTGTSDTAYSGHCSKKLSLKINC